MIINTTFVVGSDISEKWQKWLKTVFATSASEAGMDGLLVMEVLDAQSEAENSNMPCSFVVATMMLCIGSNRCCRHCLEKCMLSGARRR